MVSTAATELTLKIGDSTPIEIQFFDENGVAENFTGADKARFKVLTEVGGTIILDRTTAAANLTIGSGILTATITSGEADALVAGTYIGEVAIHFTAGDIWKTSDRLIVNVIKAVADHF
jgi:hypothetical protein